MFDFDLFNFFRFTLAWFVTIYASVITFQSLREWYLWLAGSDRYVSFLRRYIIVQGLRLRFKTFWGDVLICLLLCVIFGIVWHAHTLIHQIGDTLRDVPASH